MRSVIACAVVVVGVVAIFACGSSGGHECPAGLTMCCSTCGDNYYCSSLTSDSANCGACGAACATGEICMQGACCTPCGATACVDTKTDPQNCGACGVTCATACAGGTCQ